MPSSLPTLRDPRFYAQRALVQRDDSGDSRLPRDGPLRRVPLLPRRCLAALLSARAAAADRHARRVHPDSSAHPVEGRAVRHRHRRADRRLRRRGARTVPRAGDVDGRSAARGLRRRRARRAAALPRRRVAGLGGLPDGMSINMHPMAFAAWFGLLATALNLFPIGQLDGGHVAYAVLGRRSALRDAGDGAASRSAWRLFQRVGWSGRS